MRNQVTRLVKQGSDLSLRQLFVLFECAQAGAAGVTIKALHGPIAWDIYEAHSPEMVRINAALALTA